MKDKLIEEMNEIVASKICEAYSPICDEWQPHNCGKCYANDTHINEISEALYNTGYRKQSENVIEPPCKIGDEVYCIIAKGGFAGGLIFTGHIIKRKVDKLIYDGNRWEMMSDRVYPDFKDGNGLIYAYFGDLVFVSEEEAKNRLEEILAVGDRRTRK